MFFVLMLVSALLEVVSLGAVLPFLGVLTSPERVFEHPIVKVCASFLNITGASQLILPITVLFISAVLIAGAVRTLLLWVTTRLTFVSGADLSIEVYRKTLYQPYKVHVARNSSEVISGITIKVSGVVEVLKQLLTLMSGVVLIISILFALLAVDVTTALSAIFGFGIFYGMVSLFVRNHLKKNSIAIAEEQTKVFKVLQEGLGGIRDVLLDGTQAFYCDVYRRADTILRRALGNNIFIGGSPRFVMETIGMVLIGGLAYWLSSQEGGVASALPILGALAFGAQRMLPALQQSYAAWASIAGNQEALVDTINLLKQPIAEELLNDVMETLAFEKSIQLRDVSFRYGDNYPMVLERLNLEIRKGSRVGFVGGTGSGKSTLLDLFMGLLTPVSGEISIDGRKLDEKSMRAWQRNIAHVPQHIYLTDATIAENIAFGIPFEAIDMNRVAEAASQAQIASHVESMPRGYLEVVGEHGVRLSGGQRQRIGIARALYKRARVLVFDEATSALDNATEQAVIESIDLLSSELTILIIAHRLSTVRHCDKIVELSSGKVVAEGRYDSLLEQSSSFRKLVGGQPSLSNND
ncbi:MAG: ABC transporter ATP-binding protein [Zetaproteobacteria bacterium CG12_big_fil_rev_8_21_14_0_65_55_1124]|nr:MAG: ABC transporter ATP-binding protein [Zetaproteobacteria bacterium CG08_land_8_20_14_0_20_55_17]PIW43818.1 MAG: ABC transporter ATP-binding protein [Zetaproteobacteria bacterium CG12_big_fil_rev_8_21_14_0_65_55_1124]PIY53328.1 MAG: ABC transporter ATP-binding protein [Zetaproteobacteria bacterium CG_4_10_14_0_8_um_filter_55_43]PIZ40167.1 MAG: ABC transporter ATP-binding protein [Zetaproteobacteria bacterium CG_4_10_14_0_2_um_filter_55_20]PJB82171.1 MAG: ABC transporter ATP-binding protei